jgi:putative membrane protein (TIGR04086 family)
VIELDWPALLRGIAIAAIVAVPAALVGLWASDNDSLGWLGAIAVVVVLIGLGLGAAIAAHRQEVGSPITHGMLAALLLFLVVQGIGVVRRSLAGDDIDWSRILSAAVLALIVGAVGGLIGGRIEGRSERGRVA